jgi:DNA-binding Lrp family transcriptional regulator
MQASFGAVTTYAEERQGVGPLIPSVADSMRPLRQQIFERIRAAGTLPRVQVAKELGVSPASVTAITSELIENGLIEEVVSVRDGEQTRGRPPVALGVRAGAHLVAGIKLSDRENTAVVVDFAGNLLASETMRQRQGLHELAEILDEVETLVGRVTARAGIDRRDLSAVGIGVPGFVDSASGSVFWSPVLRERKVPPSAAV